MRFVLTGHKGLIGSVLLKRLTEEGHEPVMLVDLRDNSDVRTLHHWSTPDTKADVVFHLSAFCKIADSIAYPELPLNHNAAGTHSVLEFARKNQIPKIVFTSSTRVLYPEKNPYVASKIYGEELVKAYQQCYGVDYTIIRPSTVYGPFDDLTGRLIDKWMRAVIKNEPLKIYGDVDKTLDFTYVDDFVDGLLLASQQKNKSYDIATGRSEKLIAVAEELVKMAGSKSAIDFELPELAQPQEVEVDITEITKLGYKAQVDIKTGLQRTLDFYRTLLC
jgi:UDP-glucose 4-epimerase